MGKLNEIQEEVKQSYGSNSFTTTIKENTVEFDSAKDSFTFLDPIDIEGDLNVSGGIEVHDINTINVVAEEINTNEIKVNGEIITPAKKTTLFADKVMDGVNFKSDSIVMDEDSEWMQTGKNDMIQIHTKYNDIASIGYYGVHSSTTRSIDNYYIKDVQGTRNYGNLSIAKLQNITNSPGYTIKIGSNIYSNLTFQGNEEGGNFYASNGDFKFGYYSSGSEYFISGNDIASLTESTYTTSVVNYVKNVGIGVVISNSSVCVVEYDTSNFNFVKSEGEIETTNICQLDTTKIKLPNISEIVIKYNNSDDSLFIANINLDVNYVCVISNYSSNNRSINYVSLPSTLNITTANSYSSNRFVVCTSSTVYTYNNSFTTATKANASGSYIDADSVAISYSPSNRTYRLSVSSDNGSTFTDSYSSHTSIRNPFLWVGKINGVYYEIGRDGMYTTANLSSASKKMSLDYTNSEMNVLDYNNKLYIYINYNIYDVTVASDGTANSKLAVKSNYMYFNCTYIQYSGGYNYIVGIGNSGPQVHIYSNILDETIGTLSKGTVGNVILFTNTTLGGGISSTGVYFIGIIDNINPLVIKKIDDWNCAENQNEKKLLSVDGYMYNLIPSTITYSRGFLPMSNIQNSVSSYIGTALFKVESGALKASIDGGITWKTITLS